MHVEGHIPHYQTALREREIVQTMANIRSRHTTMFKFVHLRTIPSRKASQLCESSHSKRCLIWRLGVIQSETTDNWPSTTEGFGNGTKGIRVEKEMDGISVLVVTKAFTVQQVRKHCLGSCKY